MNNELPEELTVSIIQAEKDFQEAFIRPFLEKLINLLKESYPQIV